MGMQLFTVRQLREIEQRAAVELPAETLMQRAGSAAATWIARRFPRAQQIVIVCGPGNNGGDGYVCGSVLHALGRVVECVALAPPATSDARAAAARWQSAGGATRAALSDANNADLAIDALFGIGLARPLDGEYLAATRWLSARACVALDLPSGLDADTGTWVGGTAGVRATATISFLGAKPGLFTADGIDASGGVVVDPLGLELPDSDGELIGPEAFASIVEPRAANTHKGRFGQVVVIGGTTGMTGAALLAGRAALRLGAGRVYVDTLDGSMKVDLQQPELMFRAPDAEDAAPVAVIGCGLGTSAAARQRLESALGACAAYVLDADALNLIAADTALAQRLRRCREPRILTPHPLEAARLLGLSASEVQADRVAAARRLAERFDATVVLKGAGSVVATRERYWINPTGNAALASAGTGDVLAGMIGALLAQGYDAVRAVLAAVWLHGRAADDFGADVGLVAGEVAPLAARALGRLRGAG
ncbi:MAG: NAD(P)H-hydrate dehydratase [Burkholderiaceae bacterium]|nr:NAD(P)H-hydrate dehydratase [Burkholderiaceae bacterium]